MECNWERPGADPYWGKPIAAAVASYGYPRRAQEVIAQKVLKAKPDGVMTITHDRAMWGEQSVQLYDMHWGSGRCTGPVSRASWSMFREERALVYCGGPGQCVAVPFICGNVARVQFGHVPPAPRLSTEPPRHPWLGGPLPTPRSPATGPGSALPPGGKVHTVPAPGTLHLAVVALLGWLVVRAQRVRRSADKLRVTREREEDNGKQP